MSDTTVDLADIAMTISEGAATTRTDATETPFSLPGIDLCMDWGYAVA